MSRELSNAKRGSCQFLAAVVAAVAVAALAISGCGSSSSSSAGGGSSTSASVSSGSGSSSTSPAVAATKAEVAQLEQRPTSISVPSLPSKPPAGKTLDFIACGVPACLNFAPILKEATDAVGWNLKTLNAGLTPQTVAAAYDQAVRDKPGGVIGSGGFPTALFSHQLQELHSEGVPVVLHDQPASDANTTGVTAILMSDADNTLYGQEMANLVLADSGGHNVHLGMVITSQVPVFAYEHKALESMTTSSACVSCSYSTLQFPETAVGTTLPSEVVSFLRANPNINYLFFDFTDAVAGVPAALHAAGLAGKVKILTTNLTPEQAAYINAGQMWATAGLPWPETLWADFNVILRAVTNQPIAPAAAIKLPRMIITKNNLPSYNGQPYFPLVPDYQQTFKTAWHVS